MPRAIVRSSSEGFDALPSGASIRTRTSLMGLDSFSDELLGGEELGELGAAVSLVGDDLAGRARWTRLERVDLRPRVVEAHVAGVDAEIAQRPGLDRLLLGGHD